jgi:ribosomal protein S18 acetylase RimI-like enzyme
MPADDYEFGVASTDDELRQILALQAANMRDTMTAEERRAQGFLTLRHDLALLREMNTPYGHVIAVPSGSDRVAAYALVMLNDFRTRIPKLEPMFRELDGLAYGGRPLFGYRSYVMGQVCVAKEHRGRGLVERLYEEHRARMSPHFELMVTEIDRENVRSMRAHEKAGFEVVHEYRSEGGAVWVIVVLDLRRSG